MISFTVLVVKASARCFIPALAIWFLDRSSVVIAYVKSMDINGKDER